MDDLKQRLNDLAYGTGSRSPTDAITRIEQLEREVERFTTASAVEIASSNNRVTEYMFHWEGRALDAEAKLHKAVEALDDASNAIMEHTNDVEWRRWAEYAVADIRKVLAELEK